MGGGNFLRAPDSLPLDRYILGLTQRATPRVCFVGTASGDSPEYVERFHTAFRQLECATFDLPLFTRTPADLRGFIMGMDIIYVGGGNTRSMLPVWREWGLDEILRDAWQSGIVLAGVSAGSICWFEQGISDSVADSMTAVRGLGFLPGSNCPHYDSETERRPAYHGLMQSGAIKPGLACEDAVALHFVDGALSRVVGAYPGKTAFRVYVDDDIVCEETLAVEPLGG